ncbi:putative ribonuclease H-like domain-containing protein [Tanacetum coccineum]|uniref:Ribonuclease H-like domain-containing protein n=1 Tax=Tanacetum coccineum TaxID=301880 RepID=A0ABQ5IAZ0_9ASTR
MLVAQGYTQEEGIDYDEVFAPVVRIEAIRLFLAYASFKDFVVYQMDVKSAFLYGKIEEEVYVCQPPGFEDPDFPDRVYKVEKALCGLYYAPRAWYETLLTYLLDNGFQRGKIDNTLFIRRDKGDILLVHVYVDDIIFSSTKKLLCTKFEKMMHKKFQMSSIRKLTLFLGLQVKQKEEGIFITSLDRKSTTRGCQFLGCRLISWQCKKQTVVANSTTEADYVAASSYCGQVLWIQNQLLDYRHNLLLLLEVNVARHKLTTAVRDNVADEAVNDEMDDSLERAATTATSLDANSSGGSGRQETIRDTIAQTRSEKVSKYSNDLLLAREFLTWRTQRSAKLREITSLKLRVKKLEKKGGSRTHKLKRLYKVGISARMVSSDDASLDDQEDVFKQGRKIDDIDKDAEITLIDDTQGRYGDDLMFDTGVLDDVDVCEDGYG